MRSSVKRSYFYGNIYFLLMISTSDNSAFYWFTCNSVKFISFYTVLWSTGIKQVEVSDFDDFKNNFEILHFVRTYAVFCPKRIRRYW